nr:MAG TPA: hypothetical protein [Caudoviricetes sp.]
MSLNSWSSYGNEAYRFCAYILMTGKCRGCKPEECDKMVPVRRRRRRKRANDESR